LAPRRNAGYLQIRKTYGWNQLAAKRPNPASKNLVSVCRRGGGSEAKERPGSDLFCQYFFNGVFEAPSPRNAQKRDAKKSRKISFGFLVDIFVKVFRHAKCFCSVFELPSLRNTRNRDKT
jgi:hypothetical protein